MTSQDSWQPQALTDRLCRLLLLAYPKGFRRRFEQGMRYSISRQARQAAGGGNLVLAAFWLRFAWMAVLFGFAERLSEFGRGRRDLREARKRFQKRRGGAEIMKGMGKEIRYALRRLRKNVGFTVTAIVTIGLGIGATTAIYSVVHAVVLSPLPYPQADRLVYLWHTAPGAEMPYLGLSNGTYFHYRSLSETLEEVAIYESVGLTVTGDDHPQQLAGASVTSSFFTLLAPSPQLGRLILEEDDKQGAARVAMISDRLWRGRYGADLKVLGKAVRVNGVEYEIIGVMPPSFAVPSTETDLWLPRRLDQSRLRLGVFSAQAIGRLKEGVSPEEARLEMQGLIRRLDEPYPGRSYEVIVVAGRLTAQVAPLKERFVGNAEKTLWILLGTVGFVLLIACANVANILLVRAEGRRREVALRRALGAGRGRIMIHFLTESMLLSLLGGVFGLLLAFLGVESILLFGSGSVPRLHEIGINPSIMVFTACLSILTGMFFGVIPVLWRKAPNLVTSLKDGSREATFGRERFRARNLLAVSQIALALVLLIGAGLMLRSFANLKNVNPGFEAGRALTFRLTLSGAAYPDAESTQLFRRQVIERLSGLSGVKAVGAVTCLPLTGCNNVNPLSREGVQLTPAELPPAPQLRWATSGYFRAMGIPLLEGRLFEMADLEQQNRVALAGRSLAERFWSDGSPVGKRVFPNIVGPDTEWYTIVGVVGDVHSESLTGEPYEVIYFAGSSSRSMEFVVRTDGPALALAEPIRSQIWELDPNLPVADLRALGEIVSNAEAPMEFSMLLLVIASMVALALGVVGIYGALSYMVSLRLGEFGVRMALGARSGDLSRMILRQGAGVAGAGVGLGLVGALALTRLMESLLFGVPPADTATFAALSASLFSAALLACYLPARRAARLDPNQALRSE